MLNLDILSDGAMGTSVALIEGKLRQLPCGFIFGGFWALTGTWALMNRSLHIWATKILKIMDKGVFFYKMHFLIKRLFLALDKVQVQV